MGALAVYEQETQPRCETQTLNYRQTIPIRNHRALLYPDRTRTSQAPMSCHR